MPNNYCQMKGSNEKCIKKSVTLKVHYEEVPRKVLNEICPVKNALLELLLKTFSKKCHIKDIQKILCKVPIKRA